MNAQFSIDTEQLAFPIRTDKGEQDDFTVYPVPDKEIIDVLTSNNSRAQLWAVLPMQLEYYNAIKTTKSENSKI